MYAAGRGSGFVAVEIPFTPRAKRVLELSLEEARQLGDLKAALALCKEMILLASLIAAATCMLSKGCTSLHGQIMGP